MRKTGSIVVLLMILLGILFAGWHWRNFRNLPRRTDSGVMPELLEYVRVKPVRDVLVAEDVTPDNAFYFLEQLAELAVPDQHSEVETAEYERFRALGYQRGEYPALEQWLVRRSDLLRIAYRAAAVTRTQVVTVEDRSAGLYYLSGVRKVCEILHFEAERNADRQNWEAVTHDYDVMLTLGDHVTRGGLLSHYFTNIACVATACQSMRRTALAGALPAGQLHKLINRLAALEAGLEPIAETLRYEYLTAETELERLYEEQDEVSRTRPFAELKAYVDASFSQLIDLAEKPLPQVAVQGGSEAALTDLYRFPNATPEVDQLLRVVVPDFGDLRQEFLFHVVNLRGTATALAICAYARDNDGSFPPSLQVLYPDYLARIPTDPFSRAKAPFIYRLGKDARSWVLYSVGPNRRDDAGTFRNFQYGYRPEYVELIDVCFSSGEFRRQH